MTFKHKDEVYSGHTSDLLLVIDKAVKAVAETDVRDFEVNGYLGEAEFKVRAKK